jgi:hypothetical protein
MTNLAFDYQQPNRAPPTTYRMCTVTHYKRIATAIVPAQGRADEDMIRASGKRFYFFFS